MIEILFALIIAGVLTKSYFDEQNNREERTQLMNRIMAKTLQEYTESVKIDKPTEPTPPQDIPMDQADQSLFEKHLQTVLNGQTEDGTDTQ